MVKLIILDTNAVIYLQNGQLKNSLDAGEYGISIITEIELLSFTGLDKKQYKWLHNFIDAIEVFPLIDNVKDTTIALRRAHKIKTPDAIICATAIIQNAVLLTNDKQLLNIQELNAQVLQILS